MKRLQKLEQKKVKKIIEGDYSVAIFNPDDVMNGKLYGSVPTKGASFLIGDSPSNQNGKYWITSEVVEILDSREEDKKTVYVKFKTKTGTLYEYVVE